MATHNDFTFREGQSTTRPPYFDGNDYPYQKTMIRIYLQVLDYEIWEIVNNGCWCINTNAIDVNVQVYTTSNRVMSIQDRLHRN